MPDLNKITCIEDLRVIAQRRVPRMFYDYADSGAWTEGTYRANERDFAKIRLRQRVGRHALDRLRLAVGLLDIDAWMFGFGHAIPYHHSPDWRSFQGSPGLAT